MKTLLSLIAVLILAAPVRAESGTETTPPPPPATNTVPGGCPLC